MRRFSHDPLWGRIASVCLFLVLLLSFLSPALAAEEPADEQTLRALLIGCDNFYTMQDTTPGAASNLRTMSSAISGDLRGYERITLRLDGITNKYALRAALVNAFMGADDNDVSFLYISTHGVYNPEGDPAYMLVLSNGRYEYYLDCRDLRAMLDEIPGTKVLVFDACNSGYVIGKGGDLNAAAACFSGPDYKVITSSGCEENSFYWKTVASRFGSTGSSFFCSAFCDGIGINGSCPADADRDGRVTLGEMHRYLYDNYGAATPRVYPQNDDSFVLFVYDRTGEFWAEKPVSRIEFDSLTLTRQSPDITFSFAVTRPAQLYYQVVYYKNGAWDFQNAVYIGDSEGDDRLSPGIKRRTFSLSYDDAAQSGYILLQFFTLEEGQPRLQSSRILCAGGEDEQIGLSVSVPDTFCFTSGAEMSFSVDHAVPCSLTVSVKDSEGRTVVYLCTDAVTRPESPLNTLTYLCWDGRDRKGNPVAPGDYVICVRAESCDGVCESVVSTPVEITE